MCGVPRVHGASSLFSALEDKKSVDRKDSFEMKPDVYVDIYHDTSRLDEVDAKENRLYSRLTPAPAHTNNTRAERMEG